MCESFFCCLVQVCCWFGSVWRFTEGGVKLSKLPSCLGVSYRALSAAHHPTSILPLEFRQWKKPPRDM